MAAGIMRAEKVKTMGELAGREIHNERKREHSNTNPDIDRSRTKDNYSIGEYDKGKYSQRIEQEIAKRYKGKRAIRKDAVKCVELMFTADKSFFDKLTPELETDIAMYISDRTIFQIDVMRKHGISRNTFKKYLAYIRKSKEVTGEGKNS